ncbi:MAG: preprotein translocase subunit SecE [Lachnospiraceae bacterium]|nr:preprotein translocase subunit SecE [Lachnospiraceae bacterium]
MSDSQNTSASSAGGSTKESGFQVFWKGLKSEFRKIIWPSKETLIKQSAAVVIVSVIVGAIIAVIDRGVLYGIDFLIK